MSDNLKGIRKMRADNLFVMKPVAADRRPGTKDSLSGDETCCSELMRAACLEKVQAHRKKSADQVAADSGWEAACLVIAAAIRSVVCPCETCCKERGR